MGQKSNLLTVRSNFINPLSLSSTNSKTFIHYLKFIKFIEFLMLQKNIVLLSTNINQSANILYINLALFYKSAKILFFKKKKTYKLNKKIITFQSFKTLIDDSFPNFFLTKTVFSVINLNAKINKKMLIFFYKKLKKFSNTIFIRRFNLFIDFLKICSLLMQNKINSKIFIFFINLIFKNLSKKFHSRFFFFLSFLFKLLIFDFSKKFSKSILGIKFIIRGKIKGKPRSSTEIIKEGCIPTQNLSKNIDFAKTHSYNRIGAFGLNIWLSKNL